MVSGYRSYKTAVGHGLAAAFVLAALGFSLLTELTGVVG